MSFELDQLKLTFIQFLPQIDDSAHKRGVVVEAGAHKSSSTMSQFRSKKLDLGCFINSKIIRDHTKRKTFEQFEPQR